MNYYYNGSWRMDWGLGNPNKTATLIACLMLAIWGIAFVWKKGFWPALVLSTGLAWCLVQTYSRGGMLAFIVGTAVLLYWTPRPWPRARWIAVVASLWILGTFVLLAKAHTRYGQGLFTEDQSIGNRLIIWRHVPEMMAAAPWGWGLGRAGDSYSQWFQPTAQSTNYLNLINSHFTWMVEGGWLVSVIYLFAWLTIIHLCKPLHPFRLGPLPLAIWIAFAVGACFSAVAESPWLWIVPLLALAGTMWERIRTHRCPRASSFVWSGIASTGAVAILVLIGLVHPTLPLTFSHGEITIGQGPDRTLILADRKTLGSFYGITFRKYLAQNGSLLATHTFILTEFAPSLLPAELHRVVATGHFTQPDILISPIPSGDWITLVNPLSLPEEAKAKYPVGDKTTVFFGEYSQVPTRSFWSDCPGVKTLQVDGASDFIPAWPQALLTLPGT